MAVDGTTRLRMKRLKDDRKGTACLEGTFSSGRLIILFLVHFPASNTNGWQEEVDSARQARDGTERKNTKVRSERETNGTDTRAHKWDE